MKQLLLRFVLALSCCLGYFGCMTPYYLDPNIGESDSKQMFYKDGRAMIISRQEETLVSAIAERISGTEVLIRMILNNETSERMHFFPSQHVKGIAIDDGGSKRPCHSMDATAYLQKQRKKNVAKSAFLGLGAAGLAALSGYSTLDGSSSYNWGNTVMVGAYGASAVAETAKTDNQELKELNQNLLKKVSIEPKSEAHGYVILRLPKRDFSILQMEIIMGKTTHLIKFSNPI